MSERFGFEWALRTMKINPEIHMRRDAWPAIKQYVRVVAVDERVFTVLRLRDEYEPWIPSQADLMVEDWYEAEP